MTTTDSLIVCVAKAMQKESGGGTPFEVFERMAKAAIAAMGDASTRKDEGSRVSSQSTSPIAPATSNNKAINSLAAKTMTPPATNSSEIPLLTDEAQLGCLAQDILHMLADHVDNCQTPLRTKLCALIRPYMATREPVMSDSKRGEFAPIKNDQPVEITVNSLAEELYRRNTGSVNLASDTEEMRCRYKGLAETAINFMSNKQAADCTALEEILLIRNVAGDIDIGYFQNSDGVVKRRGNIGGIVSRACDRLEYQVGKLRDSLVMANRLLGKAVGGTLHDGGR